MLHFEVPDFVRQHGFQFRFGQLYEQCVEQHDLSEPAESSEERVRVPRAFAAVHHLDAAGAEPCPIRKPQQAVAQAALRQRREPIKQWQNQNRG